MSTTNTRSGERSMDIMPIRMGGTRGRARRRTGSVIVYRISKIGLSASGGRGNQDRRRRAKMIQP
jgi:hypothetical protein